MTIGRWYMCSLLLWIYIIVIILLLLLFLWYCLFLFLRIPKGEKSQIAQQQFLSATIQEKITPVFVLFYDNLLMSCNPPTGFETRAVRGEQGYIRPMKAWNIFCSDYVNEMLTLIKETNNT